MTYDLTTSGPPRAAMERLAEAIAAVDPTAEREDGDGCIEFLTAEAIQVALYPKEADISVPYWYEGDEADAVIARVLEYAAVLTQVGGYTVEDLQTGGIVTGPDARRVYSLGVESANEFVEASQKRRRWWHRRR